MAVPEVTRTYTELSTIRKPSIGRCVGLLPNRLQCWRAADVLCIERTETPADTTKKQLASSTERSWQLCRTHAIMEQHAWEKEKQQNVSSPNTNTVTKQ